MRRVILSIAVLLSSASAAHAYSILWGPLVDASLETRVSVFDLNQDPFRVERRRALMGPPAVIPWALDDQLSYGMGNAGANCLVASRFVSARGAGDSSAPFTVAAGEAHTRARYAFKVVGGQGSVDVEIAGTGAADTSYGNSLFYWSWSAGVVGVSSVGDSGFGLADELNWSWAGTLAYGRSYYVDFDVFADCADFYGEISLNLPPVEPPGAPVPEPASALLVLAGVGLLGLWRGAGGHRRHPPTL